MPIIDVRKISLPGFGLRPGRMTPKADADGGCVGNAGVW
jgi:hypothetical protein